VGFASSTIDTLGDSLRVEDALVLEVPALGRLTRTSARSVAFVGRTLRLRSLQVRFDGDLGNFTAHGNVVDDSVLRLVLVSAGDTQTARVLLPRSSVLPTLLPFRLAFGGELDPGTTQGARLFDPLLLRQRDVRVTIVRESTLVVADSADFDSTAMAWVPVQFDTVPAVRIDQAGPGPGTITWVDAQGRVVRAGNLVGFTVERSAFEIAYENFRRRDTVRAVRASAHPPRGAVVPATPITAGTPLDAPPRETLRLLVRNAAPDVFGPPTTRQLVVGDTLELRRDADLAARYRLPDSPDTLASWLAAEPLVQSDNPRLRAQARRIVGREPDPARAAEALFTWVRAHLHPLPGDGVPSALRAFETRRGDGNAYAVLYVALARTVGLPARTVAGLVYLEGRFYYHAWSEVYLGDWVAVDPLLGQFPADAGHVRLIVGGLARQVELLPLAGRLTLEVL
jgi:transglutaminase-like putative cysteine protease